MKDNASVLIVGPPGAGKSSAAAALSAHLQPCVVVCPGDVLRAYFETSTACALPMRSCAVEAFVSAVFGRRMDEYEVVARELATNHAAARALVERAQAELPALRCAVAVDLIVRHVCSPADV